MKREKLNPEIGDTLNVEVGTWLPVGKKDPW